MQEGEYENILNQCYRPNNKINESRSGSGIGLSITQHYVAFLGGKLEFESSQNEEIKFYF